MTRTLFAATLWICFVASASAADLWGTLRYDEGMSSLPAGGCSLMPDRFCGFSGCRCKSQCCDRVWDGYGCERHHGCAGPSWAGFDWMCGCRGGCGCDQCDHCGGGEMTPPAAPKSDEAPKSSGKTTSAQETWPNATALFPVN